MSAYNARKAGQVIAYLASKTSTRRIDVLKVMKLVYLADRESIRRHGFPILDEPHVSMPHGPVNSRTYSYIQGERDLVGCGWAEFLRDRSNHQVSVKHDAPSDWDELSDAEIVVLDHVWDQFGHMNKWELRDWTHNPENIPEWEDPDGSSLPIPIERFLLVPISPWTNRLCDGTCILMPYEHPFLQRKSYVLYRNARIEHRNTLIKGVDENYFVQKEDLNGQTFGRVRSGICLSAHTKRYIKSYFGC